MAKNYSFVKTPEELQGMYANSSLYQMKKTLAFTWFFDEAVYRKILPPGLEPTVPRANAFVSMFTHAGFSLAAYAEGALFISCAKDGVPGVYCLAMPIEGPNEMGIFMGREIYSYPKKVAKIVLQRRGEEVYTSIERNGIKFLEVNASFGQQNHPDGETLNPAPPLNTILSNYVYLIDYKLECGNIEEPAMKNLRFNNIKLFRQRNDNLIHEDHPCHVDITFRPSEDDPWCELAPTQIIGGRYQIQNTEMMGTTCVHEYTGKEADAVLPYLFTRYDTNFLGKRLEFH